jgi:hypothetical protein
MAASIRCAAPGRNQAIALPDVEGLATNFMATLIDTIELLAKLRVEGCCAATLAVFARFLTAAGAIRLPT